MSPKIEIDGIPCYYNDELGIELQEVTDAWEFYGGEHRVKESFTYEQKHGTVIGGDVFLDHAVVFWDNGYIGSIHPIHLEDE